MQQLTTGTEFTQIYQGYTMTGFGQVTKSWEIIEELGNGMFKCRAAYDNTVMSLNKNFVVTFFEQDIRRYLKENPVEFSGQLL